MTDTDFRQLCNVYGFAPSRALREMIDCVRAQEIEACAKVCEQQDTESADRIRHNYRVGVLDCAAAIRARGQE